MNRDRAKELLPVITAFANGEEVECRIRTIPGSPVAAWHRINGTPIWDDRTDYRIKPKLFIEYAVIRHDGRILCSGTESSAILAANDYRKLPAIVAGKSATYRVIRLVQDPDYVEPKS